MTNKRNRGSLPTTRDERLAAEIERERQARALATYELGGHGRPRSRREFLASGLLGFSGFVAAPSLLQLLATEARAQETGCPSNAQGVGLMPFINVNLAGGAALAGNFVPHDANRQLLPSYGTLGLGSTAGLEIVREFGNAPFPARGGVLLSKFLEGVRAGAGNPAQASTPTALNNTSFVAVCIRSADDTNANKFNIAGLVTAAGLKGSDLPILGQRGDTPTGVSHQPALISPPAPLRVTNLNDINNALTSGGILQQQLTNTATRDRLLNLVKNLSSSQKQRLASSHSGQALGRLVECATGKNIELAKTGTNGTDPRQNPDFAAAWGIAAGTGTNQAQVVQAAITLNALNGKAGAAGIELGGYDYHGAARATSDQRDRDAGVLVGRILRSAEVLGKPVFIHVSSDGSVSSNQSDSAAVDFSSENGTRGMHYILVFNPSGRPATNDFQIGHFTASQAADTQFITGWDPQRAALAVFANYLKVNGRLADISRIAPGQFDEATLGKVVKFV